MTARLLCVGDLNADVTITPGSEIVAGSDTAGRVDLSVGGSAANVAATAAAVGTPTRFVGVVGDDLLGGLLIDELRGAGVDVQPVVRLDVSTGAIAALISPNGDRSMVSDVGRPTVLHIDDINAGWFTGIAWLHLTAYSWFPPGGDDILARLIDLARQREIMWSIDPSSAEMLRSVRPVADALAAFSGASVLFPNQDEAAALAGVEDPTTAANELLELAETIVVTCGADGVVVASRGRPSFHFAAHPTEVVNTLGAGDAFAAGFIAARLGERDDEASAQAGLAAAAQAVGRSTAR